MLRLLAVRCRLWVGVDAQDDDLEVLVAIDGSFSCRDAVGLVLRSPGLPDPEFGACPVGKACLDGKVY